MLKVFLVEDSVAVRRRCADRLGAIDGVQIVGETDNAATALERIPSAGADVVIVNLRLKRGSGMDVLASLTRADPPVVTIVLTNLASATYRDACFAVGANYFFDKTTEFDQAFEAVAQLSHMRS